MYCFVIHRSRDIHQIPVRWYYQTGNNQNTDYKCCVGFYPALHQQDDQICDSETKVCESRLALLIETNVRGEWINSENTTTELILQKRKLVCYLENF